MDNPRRQLFAQEYVKDRNGTAAAIRAGYAPGSAKVTASRLLTDANVRQAIEALQVRAQEEARITAATVLKELAVLACSDVRHFALKDGKLALAKDAPDSAWRAVSSVRYRTQVIPQGKGKKPLLRPDVEFRLWDKNTALTNLAKHFALLVERYEINLTEQHLMAVKQMSDLELQAFLTALEQKKPEVALRLLPGGAA
jgi:phage terminase small subunit